MKKKKDIPAGEKAEQTRWYNLGPDESARKLGVDPSKGLSASEASDRLAKYGPNKLSEVKKESIFVQFVREYRPLMQLVLLGAAIVSAVIAEYSTAILLLVVTIFNALLGLVQERKARKSVDALKEMLISEAHVRRDAAVVPVPAGELVPGDIVVIREGDRIPADGRILTAANLEVEESTLTGESVPVLKTLDPIPGDVALGDRTNMVYMNTDATRGRAEILVTETGISTQVGAIARDLQQEQEEKTPLMRQLDTLMRIIVTLAAIAFLGVVINGLARGQDFSELFTLGVALAVGAIPDALPAVVTSILSIGTVAMSKVNAIVKRLPSVETLGSTSAICSDKTGTLTMNQMTVTTLVLPGARYNVTGTGYSTEGRIEHVGGRDEVALDPVLLPMVLCSDATVQNGKCVGDPNEGALVVLAAKGGVGADVTRASYPRMAELPFDSQYMMMATFHALDDESGNKVVRCYAKGAPDRILERSAHIRNAEGDIETLTDVNSTRINDEIGHLAGSGLRELMVASRDLDPETFDPNIDLLPLIEDLTIIAMVGIQDPPRQEAKQSIDECKKAGIRVRVITGDHAATAAVVAKELGIEGEVVNGTDFEKMSDEEASRRIEDIGVIARVAPQDKQRLVRLLQAKGDIVAMTGDGVNDAPALKAANIGVAMGVAGTDVARNAADMVLADDNFSTIVNAVREGRIIYDNMMKFIRMQMSNLIGFIVGFLAASAIAGIDLFTAAQVLWIHFGALLFIGAALGFDTPTPGLMERKPRPSNQPIIDLRGAVQICFSGVLMAGAAVGILLAVRHLQSGSQAHVDAMAQTAAMTVFAVSHIAVALNLRYPDVSVFRRETLTNSKLYFAFLWAILGMLLVTELPVMQQVFNTVGLTPRQWAYVFGVMLLIFLLNEAAKPLLRLIPRKE